VRRVQALESNIKSIASQRQLSVVANTKPPAGDGKLRINVGRRSSRLISSSATSATSSPTNTDAPPFSPKRTQAAPTVNVNAALISSNNMDMFTILRATQTLSDDASLEKILSDLMRHLAANGNHKYWIPYLMIFSLLCNF
jgi:hypothetical protein